MYVKACGLKSSSLFTFGNSLSSIRKTCGSVYDNKEFHNVYKVF